MYTRKQYLSQECNFNQYYEQFAGKFVSAVVSNFGIENLESKFKTDAHLNNIPLNSWDNLAMRLNWGKTGKELKECGDFLTQAGQTCILKTAARMAISKALDQ